MSERPRYGTVDRAYGMKLATIPPGEDGPVWMVNLMRYRAVADYADGRASSISGRDADDAYAPMEQLRSLGADVVLVADVDQQLLGEPHWDRVAVVKYPTRRSFIDLQAAPGFAEKHAHKEAGMEQTIVMGCLPMALPDGPGRNGAGPDWASVEHPPTPQDGPVIVMHVIRFAATDGTQAPGFGPRDTDDMAAYQREAAAVAVPHGLRIAGWFAVEGTIMGDGRQWHQVRFNSFPSKRAFMAVARDPRRRQAQSDHREKAIADTFAVILRPRIDRIASSIEGGSA